jgi:hypothetical protein
MHQKLLLPLFRFFAASLMLVSTLFATQAQAQLINFDLTSNTGGDAYTTGAGVFGTASSQWNKFSRSSSASSVSLFDDTGAPTSVTVSYARTNSGFSNVPTGTFASLGISNVESGTVTLAGLVAGGAYELVVFSGWDGEPSFTVDGQTKKTLLDSDWSSLNEGVHYVLFQALANGSAELKFTPNANPAGNGGTSLWSAFQLQDVPASVPEPGYVALMAAGLTAWAASRRKPSSAA